MNKITYLNKENSDSSEDLQKVPWESIARKNQLAPPGNWSVWMLLAGRGFGKTRAAAETIRKWASTGEYRRIALIANTLQEARKVMVEGESGLLRISDKSEKIRFFPSLRLVKWGSGAIATLYGAERYDQLRGPEFDAAWIDEFAKFQHPKETFEQLSFSLRLGKNPRTILTTTPRPIQFIKDLMKRKDVVTVRGTSFENIQNLSPVFLQQLKYLKGTRLEAQELYAEIVEEAKNTLWSWDDIEKCYREPPHFLNDVVVGVDPAVTANKSSDETGIIVAGMDGFGKAYILDDLSISAAPEIWGNRVVAAYKKYRARVVVVEKNAGGDLLNHLIKSIDDEVNIKMVYASKSKSARACPVVVLYQKKRIFHARQFHKLELQMATYTPNSKSPDRLDAMVWATTELFQLNRPALVPTAWTI